MAAPPRKALEQYAVGALQRWLALGPLGAPLILHTVPRRFFLLLFSVLAVAVIWEGGSDLSGSLQRASHLDGDSLPFVGTGATE